MADDLEISQRPAVAGRSETDFFTTSQKKFGPTVRCLLNRGALSYCSLLSSPRIQLAFGKDFAACIFCSPIILQENQEFVLPGLWLNLFRSALCFNKDPLDNWVVFFDFKIQVFDARLDI